MRSSIVCGLVVGGVLAGGALAAEQRPVEPGGKIGAMTVVRGNGYNADENMWVACRDPDHQGRHLPPVVQPAEGAAPLHRR